MNQEIISKPPALYKNLNMQNKPNQPTQAGPKNGIVISDRKSTRLNSTH